MNVLVPRLQCACVHGMYSRLHIRLVSKIATLVAALLLIFTTPLPSYATTLKLGHVAGHNDAIGRGGNRFKENLERISDGQMQVDIHLGGTLGGIGDLWAQMRVGVVDMQVIDLLAISLLKAAKPAQVVLLPYLFEDQQHFRDFAESELLISMLQDIQSETGIMYLGIVADRAPRIISTTTRPITSLNDVSGLKIRVPPHPMFIDIFKSWGAIPTPIPPADLFMSLKTGIVEAEDNGIINLAYSPLIEVIKHVSQINWSRSGVAAWLSTATWDRLSEQEREWVTEAARLSAEQSKQIYVERMNEALNILKEKGINIVDVDIAEFKEASAGYEKRYPDTWPIDTPAKIRELAR